MQTREREEILTAKEVAAILRLSRQTICDMAADGRLPAVNVTLAKRRPQWRFRREDVDQLLGRRPM